MVAPHKIAKNSDGKFALFRYEWALFGRKWRLCSVWGNEEYIRRMYKFWYLDVLERERQGSLKYEFVT